MREPLPRAVFLVVPLLVLHNLEEGLTIGRFLGANAAALQAKFTVALPTPHQFFVALAVVTALPLAALLVWRLRNGRFPLLEVLLALQAVMLLNVAAHVAQALLTRGYVPGLATAVLLNLPFSLYLFHRAFWERWVSRKLLATLVPIALVVHGPVLMGLMWVAGRFTA